MNAQAPIWGAAGGQVAGQVAGPLARFNACLAELLELEGGYSNEAHDNGGATMCGVTWQVYNAYRDAIGQPRQDVRRISSAEIRDIYYRFYWLESHAGDMPPGLDRCCFDFAVNSGPVVAIRKLQECLGVSADGHYGVVTGTAIARAHVATLVRRYVEIRRRFGRSLSNYWKFGRGWEARWNRVERSALQEAGELAWAAQVNVAGDTSLPSDPHDRAAEQGRAIAAPPSPPTAAELTAAGGGLGSLGNSAPRIFSASFIGGRFSFTAFAVAILSEPFFWAGLALIWATVAFWLWRRKYSRAT